MRLLRSRLKVEAFLEKRTKKLLRKSNLLLEKQAQIHQQRKIVGQFW